MTIKDCLKELDCTKCKKIGEWKGYTVYEPDTSKKGTFIGLPLVILEKDGNARISTDEESLEYLSFANSDIRKNTDILSGGGEEE